MTGVLNNIREVAGKVRGWGDTGRAGSSAQGSGSRRLIVEHVGLRPHAYLLTRLLLGKSPSPNSVRSAACRPPTAPHPLHPLRRDAPPPAPPPGVHGHAVLPQLAAHHVAVRQQGLPHQHRADGGVRGAAERGRQALLQRVQGAHAAALPARRQDAAGCVLHTHAVAGTGVAVGGTRRTH